MKKVYASVDFVNGLRQTPKDLDFCITPVLKFGRLPKDQEYQVLGDGICFGIEWGHWAVVLQLFTLKV